MHAFDVNKILEQVKSGKLSVEKAAEAFKHLPLKAMQFANIDTHRAMRSGFPEVVFCQGKKKEQVVAIMKEIVKHSGYCLGTRADENIFKAVKRAFGKKAECNKLGRTILIKNPSKKIQKTGLVAVLTAGTSDIPVAEEAAVTAEATGSNVVRIYDVGVAGIHRLFNHYDKIREAKVIIAVAGMEGALPSVVGGLVDKPVIAVPTSVGYGANFGGVSALLTMLNSCASNVVTVNIDNGFGAGYTASIINKLK
ncbi:MAG: 1-(5-phosphoribosyl)-5-amino-4-imidazole-carboxylate carboxylase [Candidatus Firestonebacteria bacterium RIFOXYA2_FULL_40_8]|nr:MAG: 1-(5-phosphoribosyl)-5-amino-4-imidazole-carboxylate carboxylase [Candidatus Firestonebacteria bacterium RIFOXYA2_FULL_40_8]